MEVKAISVVPLEEFIVVDESMLGFRQQANLISNVKIEICFPILDKNHSDFITLKSPYDGIHFFDNQLQWGEVFHSGSSSGIMDFKILCLLIKYYSDKTIDGQGIQTLANRFVSNFFIILENRSSFSVCKRLSSDNRGNNTNFTVSTIKLDNGLFSECGLISAPDCRGATPLKLEDFNYAFGNASKAINLPYQILHIARRCLHTNDYRGCVLNCASAIEIPFNNAIDKYMKDNSIPEELIRCKALKVNGIYQSAELCKNLGINLKIGEGEKTVMKKRNDVIHYGNSPSYQEAYDCYFKAMAFLKNQKIEIFE